MERSWWPLRSHEDGHWGAYDGRHKVPRYSLGPASRRLPRWHSRQTARPCHLSHRKMPMRFRLVDQRRAIDWQGLGPCGHTMYQRRRWEVLEGDGRDCDWRTSQGRLTEQGPLRSQRLWNWEPTCSRLRRKTQAGCLVRWTERRATNHGPWSMKD